MPRHPVFTPQEISVCRRAIDTYRPPKEAQCEATAPQRRRQGACEDSDVLLSGHTGPTR
jgi:hypothetical protein